MLLVALTTLFWFFLGAAVGSFLNVLIARSLQGDDWLTGRSKCDHCQKSIRWFDLVPVFSYLMLRGKSRCCQQTLSLSHPVVEFLSGALFVWWYWIGIFIYFQLAGSPFSVIQPMFWLISALILLVVVVFDARYMVIPDIATLTLTVLVFLYRLLLVVSGVMRVEDLGLSLIAAAGFFVFYYGLWYFTKGKGIGFGDVKLSLPISLLAGWPRSLVAIFAAFVIGGIYASFLLLSGKRKIGAKIPFGPYMVVGLFVALLWGDRLLSWYWSLL